MSPVETMLVTMSSADLPLDLVPGSFHRKDASDCSHRTPNDCRSEIEMPAPAWIPPSSSTPVLSIASSTVQPPNFESLLP